MSMACTGSDSRKSTESPRVLITRPLWSAITSEQRVSKTSTRSPISCSSSSLLSAVNETRSANPTVACGTCRSSSVGGRACRSGRRPPPGAGARRRPAAGRSAGPGSSIRSQRRRASRPATLRSASRELLERGRRRWPSASRPAGRRCARSPGSAAASSRSRSRTRRRSAATSSQRAPGRPAVKACLVGRVREAECAPQPAGVVVADIPPPRRPRCRSASGPPEDGASPGRRPMGRRQARRPARSRRLRPVIVLGALEEQVGELQLALSTCGTSFSATRPCSLASEIDQRAAAEDPVEQPLLVGHVADPGERDVVAGPGDHALVGGQPAVGDGVGGGQPVQERPHAVDQRPAAPATTAITVEPDLRWSPSGEAEQVAADTGGHDQHQRRHQQRLHVRAGGEDDRLALRSGAFVDRHAADHVTQGGRARRLRRQSARSSTTRRPLRSSPVAGPVRISPSGRCDRDLATDRVALGPVALQHRARIGPRARPGWSPAPARPRRRQSVRSTVRPAIASEVAVGTGRSLGVRSDVDADPDHRERRPALGDRRPARAGCRRPWPPRRSSRSLGHFSSTGRAPVDRRTPSATASATASGSSGQSWSASSGVDHGGEGQRRARPGSPRCGPAGRGPAVWWSATTIVSGDRVLGGKRVGRAGASGSRVTDQPVPAAVARARRVRGVTRRIRGSA